MTICMAATCCGADGKAGGTVVVASDRMITMGGLTEFEHDVPKITQVGPRIVTLVAGDAPRGSELVRLLGPIADATPVRTVAEQLAEKYAKLRRSIVNAVFFLPRGLSVEAFYEGGVQQRLIGPIAGQLDQQVAAFALGIEVLIAGVDEQGAHLYLARDPGGLLDDFEHVGFAAVGSGALHALQSLIGFEHAPSRSLKETVFRVFASKRRAEVAPGVGKVTDLWIIEPERVTRLGQVALDRLDALYQEYERPTRAELDKKVQEISLEE